LDGRQAVRDKKKITISKTAGINLITIPYWWQHSENFIRSRIAEQRPEIFTNFTIIPAPTQPKSYRNTTDKQTQEPFIPSQIKQLDESIMDPAGWWMTEELKNALQVYWDGSQLLLVKHGKQKPLEMPNHLAKALPPFAIEGRLWYAIEILSGDCIGDSIAPL
jgi:hypothetical protein